MVSDARRGVEDEDTLLAIIGEQEAEIALQAQLVQWLIEMMRYREAAFTTDQRKWSQSARNRIRH